LEKEKQLMEKVKHIPNYNYEDYKGWEGDWELIGGIPFSMSPSAKVPHQHIQGELLYQIKRIFKETGCKNNCFVYSDIDWVIDENNVLRPDLLIVCGKVDHDFIRSTPRLIVEILSKSSAYNDRIVKKEIYESQGVKYYLIANPENKTIETYELLNGKYLLSEKKEFILNENCKITLQYNDIWE